MTKKNRPTAAELEILHVLWEKGPSTVREVHEELGKNKDAGYTTTLKLMQIMFEKGLLNRDASSRTHIYTAAVTRGQAQGQLLDRIISTAFNGSAMQLVMQALGNYKTSAEERKLIKAYLESMEKKQKS
jgi:BlaI family penicillinase repressor